MSKELERALELLTISEDWLPLGSVVRAKVSAFIASQQVKQEIGKSGYYSDQEWINAGCPPEHPEQAEGAQGPWKVLTDYPGWNVQVYADIEPHLPVLTVDLNGAGSKEEYAHELAEMLNRAALAQPSPASAATPSYQFQSREIGESDWVPCDFSWYLYCSKSPEMDTRVVEVAQQLSPASVRGTIEIIFDGPPGHESGRFVEVEDMRGDSIRIGRWIDRGDGYWALRIGDIAPTSPAPELERPEVVAIVRIGDPDYETGANDDLEILPEDTEMRNGEALIRLADFDRIVGALRDAYDCNTAIMHARTGALSRVKNLLGNLLAVIHRDGGHYQGQHGVEKACEDAKSLVLDEREQLRLLKGSAPVAQAGQVPDILTEDDMTWLRRFSECCEDSDAGGHDLPKGAVKQLVRAGALRHCGGGITETTAFGDWMLAAAPQPAKGDKA